MDNLPKWEEATFDQPEEQLPSWDEAQFEQSPSEQSPSEQAAPSQSEEPSDWRKTGRDFLIGAVESIPGARQFVGGAGVLLGQDYNAGKEYLKEQEEKAAEQSPWAHGIGEAVGTVAQVVPMTGALAKIGLKPTEMMGQTALNLSSHLSPSEITNVLKFQDLLATLKNAAGLGTASATQAGAKSYLETGDSEQALKDAGVAGAAGYASPFAGKLLASTVGGIGKVGVGSAELAQKAASAVEKLGGGEGGFLEGLARTIPADIAGLGGTATKTYITTKALAPIVSAGGKIVEKFGEAGQRFLTPAVVNDSISQSANTVLTGGTQLLKKPFSELMEYLSPKEKKEKAQNDFAQNKNNTYGEEK